MSHVIPEATSTSTSSLVLTPCHDVGRQEWRLVDLLCRKLHLLPHGVHLHLWRVESGGETLIQLLSGALSEAKQ